MNLVGNAIKFTPQSGHIELMAERTDREVRVSVRDNGPGILRKNKNAFSTRFIVYRNPEKESKAPD